MRFLGGRRESGYCPDTLPPENESVMCAVLGYLSPPPMSLTRGATSHPGGEEVGPNRRGANDSPCAVGPPGGRGTPVRGPRGYAATGADEIRERGVGARAPPLRGGRRVSAERR